jgi:hypothetical protein
MPFFGGIEDYQIIGPSGNGSGFTNVRGGNFALSNLSGIHNIGLGNYALNMAQLANDNIAIGDHALAAAGSGVIQPVATVCIGSDAASSVETILDSVAIGSRVLGDITSQTVNSSVAIGFLANTSGPNNVVIGYGAGTVTTQNNIFIGSLCGSEISSTAEYNIIIGNNDGSTLPTDNHNIVIGDNTYTYVEIGGQTILGPSGTQFTQAIIGDPGTEGAGIDIGGVTYNSDLKVSNIGPTNIAHFIMHRHSTALPSIIVGARSNSNTSAHVPVTNGMDLFSFYSVGWVGSFYQIFSLISQSADNTGTISDTSSPGKIVFATTPDAATFPVERMRINNAGALGFAGANFGTAGQVATSQGAGLPPVWAAAGGGVTTGSWTPTIVGQTVAGTNTYSFNVGTYFKIDKLVFITGFIIMSAKDAAMAGPIFINGLPFASQASPLVNAYIGVAFYANITGLTGTAVSGNIAQSSSQMLVYQEPVPGGTKTRIDSANITATTQFHFSGWYVTP